MPPREGGVDFSPLLTQEDQLHSLNKNPPCLCNTHMPTHAHTCPGCPKRTSSYISTHTFLYGTRTSTQTLSSWLLHKNTNSPFNPILFSFIDVNTSSGMVTLPSGVLMILTLTRSHVIGTFITWSHIHSYKNTLATASLVLPQIF